MERATVKEIRDRLQKAISDAKMNDFILNKYNIKVGNATFGETSAVFKVEVATIGENGEIRDRKAEDFNLLASVYGLKPEDLGKSFTYGQETYTIIGLNSKSHKYPLVVKKNSNGKSFKFPVEIAKLQLTK